MKKLILKSFIYSALSIVVILPMLALCVDFKPKCGYEYLNYKRLKELSMSTEKRLNLLENKGLIPKDLKEDFIKVTCYNYGSRGKIKKCPSNDESSRTSSNYCFYECEKVQQIYHICPNPLNKEIMKEAKNLYDGNSDKEYYYISKNNFYKPELWHNFDNPEN